MSSILSIALSGITAAEKRLQVSANNVANANSDGPLPPASGAGQTQYPPAYVPQQVNQVATANGGTQAVVSNVQPSYQAVSDPTAPYANSSGQVASPNVDLANEAIQQQLAQTSFASNAQVINAYSQIQQTLLNIGT